jgi:hypothetical protein
LRERHREERPRHFAAASASTLVGLAIPPRRTRDWPDYAAKA